MNADAVSQSIADAKPELRKLLLRAFRDAAAKVDRHALEYALHRQDQKAILAALGIAPDGTDWPSLGDSIRDVLAVVLVPVFSRVALDTWDALGTAFDATDLDPVAFDSALAEARATILGDTLEGVQQAITLILAGGAGFGLGAVHLLAAIGMTAKQSTLFIAANRNAVRLQDIMAGAATDAARAAAVSAYLSKLPALIQSPLRKLIANGNGQITPDDIRVLSKNLARGLIDYRVNVLSDFNATAIANLAEVMVWQEAKHQGVIPADSRKFWITKGDERVRHTHSEIAAMNPEGVPIDGTFKNPLGLALHAPPAEINCRCRLSLTQPH